MCRNHGVDAAAGAVQGKGKVNVMEDYKLRMINEYKELEEKYNKLHKMLVKYDAGKLDFTPTCPIDLLRKQASFMRQYLHILEVRAVIEDVDLNTETRPDKRKQERMVTRTVSYAKGEEVVHYDMLYGFSRHDVLEKLYHYEQEEEEKAK